MSSIIQIQSQLQSMQAQTAATNYAKSQANVGKSDLSKDSFMQLMLAQMQNQNPMEPQDSTQQLMQQSSFSQLEQLQTLNKNLSTGNQMSQAAGYVGKTIDYKDDTGKAIKGVKVTSVSFGTDSISLNLSNGKNIVPEQMTQVYADAPATA